MDIEEMEKELIERGVISPPEYTPEQARQQIMEIIVTEGKDSSLGRQVWQYCKIVDFDYEAIRPILDKEPRFFSQLEELGSMQFNLLLLQIRELKAIRCFLTPPIDDRINKELWHKDTQNRDIKLDLENHVAGYKITLDAGDKIEDGKTKEKVDFESLWKTS